MSTQFLPNDQGSRSLPLQQARDAWRWMLGFALATQRKIEKRDGGYLVPSQSGNRKYKVATGDNPSCSCPDFELRQRPCKHLYCAGFYDHVGVENLTPDSPLIRLLAMTPPPYTTTRDWAAYNASQVNEGRHFTKLLWDLCRTMPEMPRVSPAGRPCLQLSDVLFSICLKTYSTLPTRRAMSAVHDAHEKGMLSRAPSFPAIYKYMEDPRLYSLLRQLVERSALPLVPVETVFAADSSWFPASPLEEGVKAGRAVPVKAHVMSGVRSNIVTAAAVTAGHSGDAPYFPMLLSVTDRYFNVKEALADKGYLSVENLRAGKKIGSSVFIPLRINSRRVPKYGRPDVLWEEAYRFYHFNRAEFLEHYHMRSNVESTFSMIKARFGSRVRSKTAAARVNEVMAKILCHNICVLIKSMYELGICPEFDA